MKLLLGRLNTGQAHAHSLAPEIQKFGKQKLKCIFHFYTLPWTNIFGLLQHLLYPACMGMFVQSICLRSEAGMYPAKHLL